MNEKQAKDAEVAGTGFMQQPQDAIHALEAKGYTASFATRFDHLEADGQIFAPSEFEVDQSFRFENTSDPSDQSILYAIRCTANGLKGTLLESYGLYSQDHSPEMLERLGHHLQ